MTFPFPAHGIGQFLKGLGFDWASCVRKSHSSPWQPQNINKHLGKKNIVNAAFCFYFLFFLFLSFSTFFFVYIGCRRKTWGFHLTFTPSSVLMISCLLSNAFMKLFGSNESMRLLSRLQLHLVNDAFVIRGRTEVTGAESRHSNRRWSDAAKK